MPSTIRPVLRIKRYSTISVLARAYAMYNGMAADPVRFATPNPPLPVLQTQIAKVEAAYKLSLTRAKGTAAACKVERDRLSRMLDTERGYVLTLCEESPGEADLIIQAAGLEGSGPRTQERPVLKVVRGVASGSVVLRANVALLLGDRKGHAKFFDWQWTPDGGQTFNVAPTTAGASTTIGNLAPLTLVGFRVKATTTGQPGEWSPIVSIVIH